MKTFPTYIVKCDQSIKDSNSWTLNLIFPQVNKSTSPEKVSLLRQRKGSIDLPYDAIKFVDKSQNNQSLIIFQKEALIIFQTVATHSYSISLIAKTQALQNASTMIPPIGRIS